METDLLLSVSDETCVPNSNVDFCSGTEYPTCVGGRCGTFCKPMMTTTPSMLLYPMICTTCLHMCYIKPRRAGGRRLEPPSGFFVIGVWTTFSCNPRSPQVRSPGPNLIKMCKIYLDTNRFLTKTCISKSVISTAPIFVDVMLSMPATFLLKSSFTIEKCLEKKLSTPLNSDW